MYLLLCAEIKRLMGCFLFAQRGLERSPYSDLLDPWHWTEVADLFAKDACKLLGLSLESPLEVRYIMYPSQLLQIISVCNLQFWLLQLAYNSFNTWVHVIIFGVVVLQQQKIPKRLPPLCGLLGYL